MKAKYFIKKEYAVNIQKGDIIEVSLVEHDKYGIDRHIFVEGEVSCIRRDPKGEFAVVYIK